MSAVSGSNNSEIVNILSKMNGSLIAINGTLSSLNIGNGGDNENISGNEGNNTDNNTGDTNNKNEDNDNTQLYKKMTVNIDLTNSNPETCITYADDAIGMIAGSNEWDEFFGHYPVLFKDGKEIGKLNPNNFEQFEDGTTADITSGDNGDVMIAFPRRGLIISTSEDENTLTVSMTDNPNDENFKYYAHTRGEVSKDIFYLGAYKGCVISDKLRSLSMKTPTSNKTIHIFRTLAQANGNGYEQSGFYQLIFRQVMYLLKYRNLNSQVTIGAGRIASDAVRTTGNTKNNGMDYGTDNKITQVKLFGIEDSWGNIYEWIDGIITDGSRNILTATDNFNNAGSGYKNNGQGATSDFNGFIMKPQGTSETGFLIKEKVNSDERYFCDGSGIRASSVTYAGGYWDSSLSSGIFNLYVLSSSSVAQDYIGARLMYI